MHGRPRNPEKPVDEAASAAKASKLRILQSQFLQFHHLKKYFFFFLNFLHLVITICNQINVFFCYICSIGFSYDKEAIDVSSKLLEINPEFYTAWNYRKLAVNHFLNQPGADPESILNEELRIVSILL